jgi:hypothetical protein
MSLFQSDFAAVLRSRGFAHPAAALWALQQMGLDTALAWHVLLSGDPVPVVLAGWVNERARSCPRDALRRQAALATQAMGLRAAVTPVRISRLPRPLAAWALVRSLIVGPEQAADRLNEARRLERHVQAVAAQRGSFRCLICQRQHGHRAARRCVAAHSRRIDELRAPPPNGYVTRSQLMRMLEAVGPRRIIC